MFYVLEIQENKDGTGGNIITSHPTKEEAMSKWHIILASAVMSNVYIHTALVLNNKGEYLARETYKHDPIISG